MIFDDQPERGRHWAAALTLSVVLHGGAAVYALGLLSFPDRVIPAEMVFPQIEVTTMALEMPQIVISPDADADAGGAGEVPDAPQGAALAPDEATAVLQPDTIAQPAAPSVQQNTVLRAPQAQAIAPDAARPLSPVIPDAATLRADGGPARRIAAPDPGIGTVLAPSATLGSAPVAAGGQTVISAALPALPATAPAPAPQQPAAPADPDLTELIARIRGRLADPCLVALPRGQGAGNAPQLAILSDSDRQIAEFERAIFATSEIDVVLSEFLFDARQCPALEFARAQTSYPTFQLSMGIAADIVPSGGVLTGTIDGTAGRYVSLLLIDANGVVQDLRRFLQFQGGRTDFEVPVTRDGTARDTHQLLMALTTAARPDTITQRAGNLAQDIFPQLRSEIGAAVQIALVPFDVR